MLFVHSTNQAHAETGALEAMLYSLLPALPVMMNMLLVDEGDSLEVLRAAAARVNSLHNRTYVFRSLVEMFRSISTF